MPGSIASQQRTLTWGNSRAFDIPGGAIGDGTYRNVTPGQVLNLSSEEPVPWLVQVLIDVYGFDGETATINATLQARMGAGMANGLLRTVFAIPAPYAQYYDQGFAPAGGFQLDAAFTVVGNLTTAAPKKIVLTAFAAPWRTSDVETLRELRALREDVRALTRAILVGGT